MADIVWTDTFTAGQTLTAAQLETMKTNITTAVNALGIEAEQIAASTITTAKLAAPNADFTILVKPVNSADALGSGVIGTAVPGVNNDQNTLNTFFEIPVDCTCIGISVYCRAANAAGSTRNNAAQLFVAGTGVGSAVQFTAGGIANSATLSQAMTTAQDLEIRVTTDSASTDGITDPHVWVHCKATHQA